MSENAQKPRIRFKGFSDAWEQRKLGELSSLITKGTTPLDKNNSGIVNFVKIESIDESSGDITITQRISIDEHNGYLRRSQLKENDILFSIAGTLGRVTSVKSSILPANTNQALAIIRLKDGCLDYVKTYLKGKAVAEFIKKNPTIGAQPNLSLEQVANLEIAIPSVSEQVKIGNYFEKLDNLITLHQCKVFYKNIIFNNIKFGGLETENNTSWEQRKFNELYEKVSEKNDLTYGTDEIISVANMYFKSDSFITDKEYLRTYNVFHLGDIAFEGNKSKNFAHGRFVENTIGDGIVSHVFDVFRPKIKYDLLFWKYAINNERLMGGILVRSTKASTMMTNLVANDFLRETILVPSLEEQKKIGSILENVDNLITLHQRIKIFFTGDYHDKKNK